MCQPTAQRAVANWLYDRAHKDRPYHDGTFTIWQEKRSLLTPFHYRDGVTIWLSKDDLTPDDDFLGQSVGADELVGQGEQRHDSHDGT